MESDKTSKQQMKPSSGTRAERANVSGPRTGPAVLLAWLQQPPRGKLAQGWKK